jgi:alpha-L-rhamnosidase
MAPATSPFTRSKWIWPEFIHWDMHNRYALFRKAFELEKVPARAPLFITADQSYQLYVNGKFVSRGPARGFQGSWPYDEVDIAAYLKKGRNSMAVRAHNPGFSNFQYLSQGFAGLMVAGRWGKTEVVTDASWKSMRQMSVSGDTVPTSVQLFLQEHIDLREEAGDWLAADFDDSKWAAPFERMWNSPPWFTLEPRGIPMLQEMDREPVGLVGIGDGKNAKGYEKVRDVVALRFKEDRSHRAKQASFAPLAIAATGQGKFRSYLFDFGKTVVGNLTFEIEGARGGEIIDTHYTETINQETLTPDLLVPSYCRMAFGDRMICREGNFTHRFYHFYGFRYLEVTVRDAEADFQLRLKLNWVGYPLERKGVFESSDKELERIWEACAWTQQCCSLDAYVDTPWREQAQWWGDARVQAWNTFHFAGDARLFRRGIKQIATQTTPDGLTYGHAPTMAHETILPDFTLIWMLTLWDYYWQTGSTEPLLTHHETVQGALDYFRKHTDPRTGLITYDDRYWLFLDWTEIFKDGAPTLYNLWLVLALEKLALLYRKMKRPRDAAPLETGAKKVRAALSKLINKEGLLRDGIDRKGKIVESTSIHAQTLALMAGLKGINEEAIMERILLPYIREEIEAKVTPSAYWVTYVFTALIERGHGEEVIAFIKKRWLPMAEHGTTWELFKPARGNDSFSHAWSAHPLFHLMNTVGGVMQTAPNWSEVTFKPVFVGAHAKTAVPTPHGLIRAEWKRAGDKTEVKLQLPEGVKARVELPGLTVKGVKKSGRWVVR